MFGDSSQDIVCSVAFLRGHSVVINEAKIALFFGETEAAPIKTLSIPKLELPAALLASRLRLEIKKSVTKNRKLIHVES